jgi:hypothetical protein
VKVFNFANHIGTFKSPLAAVPGSTSGGLLASACCARGAGDNTIIISHCATATTFTGWVAAGLCYLLQGARLLWTIHRAGNHLSWTSLQTHTTQQPWSYSTSKAIVTNVQLPTTYTTVYSRYQCNRLLMPPVTKLMLRMLLRMLPLLLRTLPLLLRMHLQPRWEHLGGRASVGERESVSYSFMLTVNR